MAVNNEIASRSQVVAHDLYGLSNVFTTRRESFSGDTFSRGWLLTRASAVES